MGSPESQFRGPGGSSLARRPVPGGARVWLPTAALLPTLLLTAGPARATCGLERRFDAGLRHVQIAEAASGPFYGHAVFWAVGFGHPAVGSGIDNGTSQFLDDWSRYYGYYIDGSWGPGTDGCLDAAGASPALDGDECMAVLFSDQSVPYASVAGETAGFFAVLAAQAVAGADPAVDFSQTEGTDHIWLAPIPPPTSRSAGVMSGAVALTLDVAPAPPDHAGSLRAGVLLDPACEAGVVAGYRIVSKQVPRGAPPPTDLRIGSGWAPVTPTLPFGADAEVSLSCGTGADVYLAAVPVFDSGFEAAHVSRASKRVNTETDADADGMPDACDACTDRDGDGFGDRGFLSNTCPLDNCPQSHNPTQADADVDGVGDACDQCLGHADPCSTLIVTGPGDNAVEFLPRFTVGPDGARAFYLEFGESGFELFSVPVSGGTPTRLSMPLPARRDVFQFAVSPDGAKVVFQADQAGDDVFEIFSVPAAGGTPTRLNGPLVLGGDVVFPTSAPFSAFPGFRVTGDGTRVVYLADQETDDVFELFVVPIDGSQPPLKLDGPPMIPAGGNVFVLAPGDERVLYLADPDGDALADLFSVPLTGAAGVEIGDRIRHRVNKFVVGPDGSTVVFTVRTTGLVEELYSAPVTGGTPIRLNPRSAGPVVSMQIDVSGSRVVYTARQDSEIDTELYSVPISGGPSTKLSLPVEIIGVEEFRIAPDGATVVYRGDHPPRPGERDLFSVQITGGTVTKLSAPLIPEGEAWEFAITPDSERVVFRGDQTTRFVFELFSVPIGGGPVILLNPPLTAGGRLDRGFTIGPDGREVLYVADQEIAGLMELYSVPVAGGAVMKLSDADVRESVAEFAVAADGSVVVYKAPPGLYAAPLVAALDADADGLLDHCDVCPAVSDPAQTDSDGDGAGDACDCLPGDPTSIGSPPGPVRNIGLDGSTLTWDPPAEPGGVLLQYDAFRGSPGNVSLFPASFDCVLSDSGDPVYFEPSFPAPGSAWIYLVRAQNGCGVGPAGPTAGGLTPSVPACP